MRVNNGVTVIALTDGHESPSAFTVAFRLARSSIASGESNSRKRGSQSPKHITVYFRKSLAKVRFEPPAFSAH